MSKEELLKFNFMNEWMYCVGLIEPQLRLTVSVEGQEQNSDSIPDKPRLARKT